MENKFYKTVFKVTVLSEGPYEYNGIRQLAEDITDGDCSGVVKEISTAILSPKKAAEELIKQGSSPEFFMLDKDGNEIDF